MNGNDDYELSDRLSKQNIDFYWCGDHLVKDG